MITISLCMIVKDEQAVLARCLDSVKDAVDEIIIVDTGSTDNTREIAAQYTDQIYDFQWVDDFSAARNFAFNKAGKDYQMWLDADDILPPGQAEKLLLLKENLPPQTNVVTMKYHTHFDSQGNPVFTSTRGRLFRRSDGFQWMDAVHEFIPMTGVIHHSDIEIWHKKQRDSGDRNLRIYKSMEAGGKSFTPRNTYYYARELMDHSLYEQATNYFGKFLDDGGGWLEDEITSCLSMARCYKVLGDITMAKKTLVRSMEYDSPRPEICCELGYIYKAINDTDRAIHWFEAAVSLPEIWTMGFVQKDYSGYIPHIELCVCYCIKGDYKKASIHNEMAAGYKPGSKSVEQNRKYLATVMDEMDGQVFKND